MEHAEMSKELAAIQNPTSMRLSPTVELADGACFVVRVNGNVEHFRTRRGR